MDMNSQQEINKPRSDTTVYITLLVIAFVVCWILAFLMLHAENKVKDPNDPSYKTTGQLIGQSAGLGAIALVCLVVFYFIISNSGTIVGSGLILFGDIFGAIFKLIGGIFDIITSIFS
jgi:hypothetical protein